MIAHQVSKPDRDMWSMWLAETRTLSDWLLIIQSDRLFTKKKKKTFVDWDSHTNAATRRQVAWKSRDTVDHVLWICELWDGFSFTEWRHKFERNQFDPIRGFVGSDPDGPQRNFREANMSTMTSEVKVSRANRTGRFHQNQWGQPPNQVVQVGCLICSAGF